MIRDSPRDKDQRSEILRKIRAIWSNSMLKVIAAGLVEPVLDLESAEPTTFEKGAHVHNLPCPCLLISHQRLRLNLCGGSGQRPQQVQERYDHKSECLGLGSAAPYSQAVSSLSPSRYQEYSGSLPLTYGP